MFFLALPVGRFVCIHVIYLDEILCVPVWLSWLLGFARFVDKYCVFGLLLLFIDIGFVGELM